jgi:hypothetical protein
LAVGIEKIQAWQLLPRYPADLPKNAILQLSVVALYQEKLEVDGVPVVIEVLQVCDLASDLRHNTQLFVKFALQRFRRAFTRFDLSPRELPLERQRLILRPLTAENFFAADDQGGDNLLHQKICLISSIWTTEIRARDECLGRLFQIMPYQCGTVFYQLAVLWAEGGWYMAVDIKLSHNFALHEYGRHDFRLGLDGTS